MRFALIDQLHLIVLNVVDLEALCTLFVGFSPLDDVTVNQVVFVHGWALLIVEQAGVKVLILENSRVVLVIFGHDFDEHARTVLLVIVMSNDNFALELVFKLLLDLPITLAIHKAKSTIVQVKATNTVATYEYTEDVELLQAHDRLGVASHR